MELTRREFIKITAGAAIFSGVSACAPQPASTIRILWTNDIHGHLVPVFHREAYGDAFLKDNGIERDSVEAYVTTNVNYADLAKKFGKVGGYAHLAALVEKERAVMPTRTLLLDAGDAWYGSAMALLTEGKALVEVMNALNYDAMTLHWEFNLGKDALLARIKEAKFPVLAQNLIDTDFGDRVLTPSIVKDFGDTRIGIVGQAYPFSLLTTELRDANPGWRMGYQDEELAQEIARVREKEKANVVILLSHMGLEQDRIIAERIKDIDVIVGAHTHDILWKPLQIGKTIIVQAGSHGKFLGELDLDLRGGKLDGFRHKLIPILAERIEPDAKIQSLISNLYKPFESKLRAVVGETRSLLYRRSLYGGTSDAFMVKAYREIIGSDVGCASGWRFGTSVLPGPLTVEDVYNAMKPTPSPLYKATLSGRQIRASLEDNLDNVFNADPLQRLGGDALRCTGIKAGLKKNAARGERVVGLMINDQPVDEDKKYLVATSGGRTQYLDAKAEATKTPAVDELIGYIKSVNESLSAEPLQSFTEVS